MTHLEYWNIPTVITSPLAGFALVLVAGILFSGSDFGFIKLPKFGLGKRIASFVIGISLIGGIVFAMQPVKDAFVFCNDRWVADEHFGACNYDLGFSHRLLFVEGRNHEGKDEYRGVWYPIRPEFECLESNSSSDQARYDELRAAWRADGFVRVWENSFYSETIDGLRFQSAWVKEECTAAPDPN